MSIPAQNGSVTVEDFLELAPRVCPTMRNNDQTAARSGWLGQAILTWIFVDLEDAIEPDQESLGVFTVATRCRHGIAKAHAFVDGNKRTAFVAAFTFMRLNGVFLRPDAGVGVRMMEELASDQVSEAAFVAWLHDLVARTDTA